MGAVEEIDMVDLDTYYAGLFVLLCTPGRRTEGRVTVALWLVLYLASTFVVGTDPENDEGAMSWLWGVLLLTPPLLAGRAVRSRRRLQLELEAKNRELEATRAERAARAVDHERAHIAGELQAAVANSVSAMVVQAEAVPRVLGAGDSARAAEALERIEETGRDARTEMRRLLGVLRRDDEGAALAPQPGLAQLSAL